MSISDDYASLLLAARHRRIRIATRIVPPAMALDPALKAITEHYGQRGTVGAPRATDRAVVVDTVPWTNLLHAAPTFFLGDVPVYDVDTNTALIGRVKNLLDEHRLLLPYSETHYIYQPEGYFNPEDRSGTVVVRARQPEPGEDILFDHFCLEMREGRDVFWSYVGVQARVSPGNLEALIAMPTEMCRDDYTKDRKVREANQYSAFGMISTMQLLEPHGAVRRPAPAPISKRMVREVSNAKFPFPSIVHLDLTDYRPLIGRSHANSPGRTQKPHGRRATLRMNPKTGVKDIKVRAARIHNYDGPLPTYVVKT